MSFLKADHLSIGYDSPLQENVSFSLSSGEILIVSGPNGSGKSTFLKTVLGELKPLAGRIEFSSSSLQIEHLPQLVSYDLPISVTLGEVLESFEISDERLRLLDPEFFAKKWNEASGGEKQKTLILSRLAKNCDLLILDEPFNHLDKQSTLDLKNFLVSLLDSQHLGSLVIVSHISTEIREGRAVKELNFQ